MSHTITEISEEKAALLRLHGLPEGVTILERDEVISWGNVYSRSEGSCLYIPEHLDPIEQYAPRPIAPPIACDLFAGCGGFSLGVEMGGIDVACAVEMSLDAAHTYLMNLGRPDTSIRFDTDARRLQFEKKTKHRLEDNGLAVVEDDSWLGGSCRDRKLAYEKHGRQIGCRGFYCGDITKITGSELLDLSGVDHFDIIFGGPPCQGMSTSNNKRAVDDPRNAMLFEFMRMVVELKPKVFMIENVPPLLTFGNGVLFKRVVEIANDNGYNVVANILDAANYGVPQYRRRAFIVGSLGDIPFQFPMPHTWGYGSRADGETWDLREWATDGDEESEATKPSGKKTAAPSLFDME